MGKSPKPGFLKKGALLYLIFTVLLVVILVSSSESKKLLILLLVPLFLLAMNFMDAAASEAEPELYEDPLIGRQVRVVEPFSDIDGGFEGRVELNGATWDARSATTKYESGDSASVSARNGHLLELV